MYIYSRVGSYFDLVWPKCVNKYCISFNYLNVAIALHSVTSYLHNIVRNTISMCSMPKLGGLGACPPRNFLKTSYSDIDFDGIFEVNLL